MPQRWYDLSSFSLLTHVPSGIKLDTKDLCFKGCTLLKSVKGLPRCLNRVDFTGCTSLTSVAELPAGLQSANFTGCTSLLSVAGLPCSLKVVHFQSCASLISTTGLPGALQQVDFTGCRRLRRFTTAVKGCVYLHDSHNPADEVHTCMRSGMSDRLLERVGPDVALLVGCFVTAGVNSSPLLHDRMETHDHVVARFSRAHSRLAN